MNRILCSKKYVGILWAIVIASAFVISSLLGRHFFVGMAWYIYSSILRLVFGFFILVIIKKVYNRPVKEVLSIKESKRALIAGSGFIIYFLYSILLWGSGIKSITGLTVGLFVSQIILQQITTGFYEELNYRFLILEGYFYGTKTIKSKLMYSFISFVLFGAVHVVNGWDTYTFLRTGVIGHAFAVMYLNTRNILIPMVLHFLYDIAANLTYYMEWKDSTLHQNMNLLFDIMLFIMFTISLIMILKRGNSDVSGRLLINNKKQNEISGKECGKV